jgi:hypothetical protein
MYVSQPLRYIDLSIDRTLETLELMTRTYPDKVFVEKVGQ